MIVGKPAQEIIDQYHEKYRSQCTPLREMLNSLGVPFKSFDTADYTTLNEVGVYMVTVPSLNIRAGTHQILIEVGDFDYEVIDPVAGHKERFYYVKRGDVSFDFEVELSGFQVDAFISWTYLKDRA